MENTNNEALILNDVIKKFCDSTTESLNNNSNQENTSVVRKLAKEILTYLPHLDLGISPKLNKEILEEIQHEGLSKSV